MSKTRLYLLAATIAVAGLAAIGWKWQVLRFPLQPSAEVSVWTVQAHIEYRPRRGPNMVTLRLPAATPGFTILDERFVARDYSNLIQQHGAAREVQWAIRRARGPQSLYYRADVVRGNDDAKSLTLTIAPQLAERPELAEPRATAAQSLLDQVRKYSANVETYARELVRRFNQAPAAQEVEILRELAEDQEHAVRLFAGLLAMRNIPAMPVHGLILGSAGAAQPMRTWLAVHDGTAWHLIDPNTGASGWPHDLFVWSAGHAPLLDVADTPGASVQFTVAHNLADAMAVAERRLEVQDANLVRYSLLSLPLQTQAVYRVLLMIPIGAFIMLVLRNIVGIKTFGTFMPVLIALAFRDTGVFAGVVLFALVVGAGLLVRFYLERLRLLLVPRLTAILIVVVLLMAWVGVLSNRLGIEVGLSVALFPMVIMTMTIERMSIAWDERGATTALREGFGSLLVAALAYLAMSWPPLEHLVFVFPEVLLVILALTLLLGRYSGYRLMELFRFRSLAAEVDPITPPGA